MKGRSPSSGDRRPRLSAEQIPGYAYELHYIGVDAATDIAARGITLEEYAGAQPSR
jgi:hypothetical protein